MYQRMFQGMPVRDAKEAIRVQPDSMDIKLAKRGDPNHCAYAECLRRQWKTDNVWIFKRTAYMQVLDEHGLPVVERFTIGNGGQKYIQDFDNGKPVKPAGFVLSPPSLSHTLDYQRVNRRPDKPKAKHKKAHLRKESDSPIMQFRDGHGMACFKKDGVIQTRVPYKERKASK